jgi:two-component system sensor histidine kinase CpxA
MRGLFFRIFLMVLVAVLTAFGVGFLSAGLVLPLPHETIGTYEGTLTAALATGDLAGARRLVAELSTRTAIRATLLDPEGHSVAGGPLPDDLLALARSAQQQGGRILSDSAGIMRQAAPIAGSAGVYTLVTEHDRGLMRLRRAVFDSLQVVCFLVALGVASFLLARYIARPVLQLRSVVRSFAGGALETRIGTSFGTRRDELAELGRDFDAMAERIATLLLNQRRLLQDISHELRSPLTRQAVALEQARRSANAEAAEALDRASREAARMEELIGELLTLTRLEAGVPIETNAAFDLDELIASVVADVGFEGGGSVCTIQVDAAPAVQLSGVRELIRRALENVLRNAIRYSPPGACVKVIVRQEAGWVVVQVRDHGPGVPQSELANIFQPFYRVSAGRERATGGTGLGLAIADRAVRSHGGAIVAANAPEGGLVVEIRLPQAAGATS